MPADNLRGAITELMGRAQTDLAELVAFRSVADPKQFPPDGSKAVHGYAPGPAGSPTVLLYSHYDVQPPLGEDAWTVPIWELTERDGRWYGRGSADCKGNIVMHLTAL